MARVAYEQTRRLGYYHSYRHNGHEPGIELAEHLIKIAPVPMSKVLFQCSGSEANDTAIKLVWYCHAALGKPHKHKIIGRRMGYHGNTCAAISASGKSDMHADFGLPYPGYRTAGVSPAGRPSPRGGRCQECGRPFENLRSPRSGMTALSHAALSPP